MSIMNLIVYEAFLKDVEEARENGRKIGRKEARREYDEWLRKVATGCLMSGVDPDIVCRATGYSMYKLMDMMPADTN